ncbi:hypothetical protein PLICRDRAFT_213990 [Plicaturopsis crispa FD-325 SS-3]|nr:hypothetical protein PLICRDRAFT_213990 [Plicaturopsis crispa FD-325 SS-3]
MSWSLDPRRPDPAKNPEGWYKFWEEELEWSFSRPWERLVKDSEPQDVSQAMVSHMRLLRTQIGSLSQQLSKLYVTMHSRDTPIENLWKDKGVKGREDLLVESLVSQTSLPGHEDYWQFCPEVTKKSMCSGDGEGLINVLKHFIVTDIQGKPPTNFPILKHPDVWRLFDFSPDDAAEAKRPKHVQAYHDVVLVVRHYFLVHVVLSVLSRLVGVNVNTTYLKAPKTDKKAIKHGRAVDPNPLPKYVYDLVDQKAKHERATAKENADKLMDWCYYCNKTAPIVEKRMMCCSGCKKVGRQVTYCSRECQIKDYKTGTPPHKVICSKILETSALPTEEDDPFPLYTSKPSPELLLQVYFLRRDGPKWDYHLVLPGGRQTRMRKFHGGAADIFLEARAKAMREQDKVGVAIMRYMLGEDSEKQLEKEYEVDMKECFAIAEAHPRFTAAREYKVVNA